MAVPSPPSSPAHGSMVSSRSRRLRIIGSLLLVAIAAMVVYGVAVLMPSLRRSVAETSPRIERRIGNAGTERTPEERLQRKALATQLIFTYSYWTVCGVLVLVAVFVAYLDFREVSRTYLAQRRAIWSEVAERSRDA